MARHQKSQKCLTSPNRGQSEDAADEEEGDDADDDERGEPEPARVYTELTFASIWKLRIDLKNVCATNRKGLMSLAVEIGATSPTKAMKRREAVEVVIRSHCGKFPGWGEREILLLVECASSKKDDIVALVATHCPLRMTKTEANKLNAEEYGDIFIDHMVDRWREERRGEVAAAGAAAAAAAAAAATATTSEGAATSDGDGEDEEATGVPVSPLASAVSRLTLGAVRTGRRWGTDDDEENSIEWTSEEEEDEREEVETADTEEVDDVPTLGGVLAGSSIGEEDDVVQGLEMVETVVAATGQGARRHDIKCELYVSLTV